MTLATSFLHDLEAIALVKRDEPLARYTTFGVGGPADAYVVATDPAQVAAAVRLCRSSEVPFFVLGSGSNIVIGDRGIRGVTIGNDAVATTVPGALGVSDGRTLVRADAGCSFAGLARHLAYAGYAGLEWACGIPGTVGGAVVYNAGAYGGCLGDVLIRAGLAGGDDAEEVLSPEDLGLVYRGSAFTRGLMAGRAVLWAEVGVWPDDPEALRERVKDYDSRRLAAQPRGRNAGSFFKNPGQPAWKLLDGVGLRGYRIGGAQFSHKHCNFMINAGDATAADVAALKRLAQQRVRDQFGIEIENEVALVGEGFGEEDI